MSWRAGAFDPDDRLDCSRLNGTSNPGGLGIVRRGPLRVSVSEPPVARSGPLCLLDGVIDNLSVLARELGCTEGSPEQLLAAGYQRWGSDLLPRLRGDFALVLWDEQRGQGLLARDQLGVRSVFLSDGPGGLYFATDIHHLLALLPCRPAPDPVGVAHWLAISGRPGAGTLYAGIRRLNPGSLLLIDRRQAREMRYWEPRFSEPLDAREPDLSRRMRQALDDAVNRRIDRQAPTGVLMSGGLDSASVAAVAAQQAPGRVLAYAGVFPEHPAVDEAELIDELRDCYQLGGLTASVRSGGLIGSALESLAAFQLPLVGWGDFWTLPLLQGAAAQGIGTILGGDGGDELFGARAYLLADHARAGRMRHAMRLARELPGAGDRPARREVASVFGELALLGALPHRPHRLLLDGLARRDTPRWLRSSTRQHLRESEDPLAWKRLNGPRWWAHTAHGLTRGVEETGVFEHQRRRATLAALQARHPLFDLDLVELGLRLPPQATFDRNLSRPQLRGAMASTLPNSVRLRPAKAWFDSLIVDCLTGPDHAAVLALLGDRRAELGAYVELDRLRRTLLDIDPRASRNRFRWMHQVWRLVTIECWLRSQRRPVNELLAPDGGASATRIVLNPAHSYLFPP
jgi:asparagine synthase (glutamine-hydrolysing)